MFMAGTSFGMILVTFVFWCQMFEEENASARQKTNGKRGQNPAKRGRKGVHSHANRDKIPCQFVTHRAEQND